MPKVEGRFHQRRCVFKFCGLGFSIWHNKQTGIHNPARHGHEAGRKRHDIDTFEQGVDRTLDHVVQLPPTVAMRSANGIQRMHRKPVSLK